MAENSEFEYLMLYYVPQAISSEQVCIAVIIHSELESVSPLFVANQWETRVQGFDPDADLIMLQALLSEIGGRLGSPAERHDMLIELEESFSNTVQVSARVKCELAKGVTAEDFAGAILNRSHQKAST